MKSNKKAAMELGISTVVMLVIAIVIIGAGVAFIRGFFTTGEGSLMGAFDLAEFRIEPSRNNPLVISSGTSLEVSPDTEVRIGIGFFNKEGTGNYEPRIRCQTNNQEAQDALENIDPAGVLDLLVSRQNVGSGAIETFEAMLSTPPEQANYACTLEIFREVGNDLDMQNPQESNQFIMHVRN